MLPLHLRNTIVLRRGAITTGPDLVPYQRIEIRNCLERIRSFLVQQVIEDAVFRRAAAGRLLLELFPLLVLLLLSSLVHARIQYGIHVERRQELVLGDLVDHRVQVFRRREILIDEILVEVRHFVHVLEDAGLEVALEDALVERIFVVAVLDDAAVVEGLVELLPARAAADGVVLRVLLLDGKVLRGVAERVHLQFFVYGLRVFVGVADGGRRDYGHRFPPNREVQRFLGDFHVFGDDPRDDVHLFALTRRARISHRESDGSGDVKQSARGFNKFFIRRLSRKININGCARPLLQLDRGRRKTRVPVAVKGDYPADACGTVHFPTHDTDFHRNSRFNSIPVRRRTPPRFRPEERRRTAGNASDRESVHRFMKCSAPAIVITSPIHLFRPL